MSTLAHLVEQRLMADVEHRKEMFTSRIKQLIMSGAGREAIIRDILQRWLSKALETFWKAQEKDLFLILLEEFGSESEYKPEDLRLNFVVEELVKEWRTWREYAENSMERQLEKALNEKEDSAFYL